MKYIYKIVNHKNNKIYIGQTKNFNKRIYRHKYDLKKYKHCNKDLQNDYSIYGLNNFNFEIIEQIEDHIANDREDYWIELYGGINCENLYNRVNNKTQSEASKDIHREIAHSTHKTTSAGRARISKANKGKIITEEQRKKISIGVRKTNAWVGRHHTEETKQKLSLLKKGKYCGKDNPNYKYTPEFIELLRKEYAICKNYSLLSRKYNICDSTISRLIRLGKT